MVASKKNIEKSQQRKNTMKSLMTIANKYNIEKNSFDYFTLHPGLKPQLYCLLHSVKSAVFWPNFNVTA